jgi:hypothetical protein
MDKPSFPSVPAASAAPIAKVVNGGIAGAVVCVGVYLVKLFWKVEIPSEVSDSLTLLASFSASYLTPIARRELRL